MFKKGSLSIWIMLLALAAVTFSCNKHDDDWGEETKSILVTTYTPTDVTSTTAVCGGHAVIDFGISFAEIGICWSVFPRPTINDNNISTEYCSEPFTYTISGLEPETQYHVRAYAKCGSEYYYGEDKSFTTTGNLIGNTLPNINVLIEEGYVKTGDVVDVNTEYNFGFVMASNIETDKELASLILKIDDNVIDAIALSGKNYTYRGTFVYELTKDEIIDISTITAIVTDVAGKTVSATINLSINYPDPDDYTLNYVGNYIGQMMFT